MAKLISFGITSLDGYVADDAGNFDWGVPDDEVHAFVNDFERQVGTYLYGRRLYDVMTGWEKVPADDSVAGEFAGIWRAADKIVYSTSLKTVATGRTRIERMFNPDAVQTMKLSADRDITVGGAELAAHAIRVGLVDEIHTLISPVIVGGGKPFLPDDIRLDLELIDERRFGNGVVHLAYAVL